MVYNVNLTTKKDTKGSILLTQKLKFSERLPIDAEDAKRFRKYKQTVLSHMLRTMGYDIADNNEVVFGIFDTKTGQFYNTTSDKFLEDFIVLSLIKGHFMGNKGYTLRGIPDYKKEIISQIPANISIKKNSC